MDDAVGFFGIDVEVMFISVLFDEGSERRSAQFSLAVRGEQVRELA